MPFSEKKQALRRQIRSRRQSIPLQDRLKAATRLTDHLTALAQSWPPQTIAGYHPMGSEIDITPAMIALEKAGHRMALPAIHDQTLQFRLIRLGDPLQDGPHTTFQPGPDRPLCRPKVLLVPLIAFDRALNRLGQGAGYYDRAIASLRQEGEVQAIGIAYECQRLEMLPAEPHDQKLDLVITEDALYHPITD